MNNLESGMGLSSSNTTQRHYPPVKDDINRQAAPSNILSPWDQADRIPILDLSHSRNFLGQGARRPHQAQSPNQSLSHTLYFPALMILQSRLSQITADRMGSLPLTRPLEVLKASIRRTKNPFPPTLPANHMNPTLGSTGLEMAITKEDDKLGNELQVVILLEIK
jgi:hypothetical protein